MPSSDRAFTAYVAGLTRTLEPLEASALEARLRRLFPNATVRPRQLAGERPTWYVYREGRWVDGADDGWWHDPSLARLGSDRQGWIRAANEAAGEHFGLPPRRLIHRHSTDFVLTGTPEDWAALLDTIALAGEMSSTIRHLSADGRIREARHHTRLLPGGFETVLRAVGGPGEPPVPHTPIPISTEPVGDEAFALLADLLLRRMPEPTPNGLALRLRRTYPHATVDADGSHWRIRRDAAPEATEGWWESAAVASVEYDRMGRVLRMNDRARALLGRDALGWRWDELLPPRSLDEDEAMRSLLESRGEVRSTLALARPEGPPLECDVRTTVEAHGFRTRMVARHGGPLTPAMDPGRPADAPASA